MAWCSSIVRDRLAIIKAVREQPDGNVVVWNGDMSCFIYPPQRPLTFWRRWLGDQNIAQLTFPANALDEELIEARRCFPEAYVGRVGGWATHWPENSVSDEWQSLSELFEQSTPGAN